MRLGKPGDAVSTSGSVMRQIINEQLQISESNPIKARYYDYDRFTYPWHFHSQYEIIYVKKSCGRCFVGDCIERFSEGDVVLFGPSLPHYMRSDDAYHGDNPRLRVQGTIIQFEENFMQYSFDHYPQFHQIRVLLKEARRCPPQAFPADTRRCTAASLRRYRRKGKRFPVPQAARPADGR